MKTWRDIDELSDRGRLVALIEEYGTPTRIARAVGCSVNNVRGALKFYGLKPRVWTAGEKAKERLDL